MHARLLSPTISYDSTQHTLSPRRQVEDVGRTESAKALLKVARELAAATSGSVVVDDDDGNDEMVDAQLVEQLELGGTQGTAALVHLIRATVPIAVATASQSHTASDMVHADEAQELKRRIEELERLQLSHSEDLTATATRAGAAEADAASARAELARTRAQLEAALASSAKVGIYFT